MTIDRYAMTDMVALLEQRADELGDHRVFTFLVDGEAREEHMTVAQLRDRARAIAAELARLGAAGERALLLYPPGLDYVAAFFGCLHAGVIAVPAYPPNPAQLDQTFARLRTMALDAQPLVALTTAAILPIAQMLARQDQALRARQRLAT